MQSGSWRKFPTAWNTQGCYTHSYHRNQNDLLRCFQAYDHGMEFLFIGDSTSRQVFWGMVGMSDGLYGTGNYSSYTSKRHSDFELSTTAHNPLDPSAPERKLIYKFIWDPFFNSSALKEVEMLSTKKHTPIAFVYTSIGLWFSRSHFDPEDMDIHYRAAMNRALQAYKSLKGSTEPHSLFLAPTLHPHVPLMNEDRAKTITHEKVSILNGIINRTKQKLSGIEVPTVFNLFSKEYPESYDHMGIHFTPTLAGLQASIVANERCNNALTNIVTTHQSCCSKPPSTTSNVSLLLVFIFILLIMSFARKFNEKSPIIIITRLFLWMALWYAVVTGIGGVRREMAESTDVLVSIIGWFLSFFFWFSHPGLPKRLRFSILGKVHSYYDSAKGATVFIYLFLSFHYPDMPEGPAGTGVYWLFANLMSAFLLFDSTRIGSIISYSTSNHLNNVLANQEANSANDEKQKLRLYAIASIKSISHLIFQNCYSVFLVLGVKWLGIFGMQKPLSPSFLIFQSEKEFALVLVLTSFFSWLFFLLLRQTQFAIRHYHPSEDPISLTRTGFKTLKFTFFAILIGTIYTLVLYLAKTCDKSSLLLQVTAYPGLFTVLFLSSMAFHYYQFALTKNRVYLTSIAQILLSILALLLSSLIYFAPLHTETNQPGSDIFGGWWSWFMSQSPGILTSLAIAVFIFLVSTSSLEITTASTTGAVSSATDEEPKQSLQTDDHNDHHRTNKTLHDYSLINTIGVVGQHGQELLLVVLCIFYFQIFENSTVDASLAVDTLNSYYWTIPRLMWFHLAPLPYRICDAFLISILVVQSVRDLAEVAFIKF